jgi:hypothetical protein
MTGIERIAAERKRQIEEEGFTAEHDDRWGFGELACTAACYAMPEDERTRNVSDDDIHYYEIRELIWPFLYSERDWKPTLDNRIRELEKAGALIAAEIDRLQRLEQVEATGRQNEQAR